MLNKALSFFSKKQPNPAQKGAAHLDRVRPGWYNQIDLNTLNMMQGNTFLSQSGCIICQLDYVDSGHFNGSYMGGIYRILGWHEVSENAVTHGFLPLNSAGWSVLKNQWTVEIQSRREQDAEVNARENRRIELVAKAAEDRSSIARDPLHREIGDRVVTSA